MCRPEGRRYSASKLISSGLSLQGPNPADEGEAEEGVCKERQRPWGRRMVNERRTVRKTGRRVLKYD